MGQIPSNKAYLRWEKYDGGADFLQLSDRTGGVLGWIDSSGSLQGNLLQTIIGQTALKPSLPNDPVQYVSPNGDDTNDGLSWGSAKKTITGALKALPGGSSTTAGKGTVLVSGTVAADPVGTTGIWLMGSGDPNFSNPPTGWLRYSGPISIEGVNRNAWAANGTDSLATIAGGGITDLVHPAIWLSSIAQGFKLKGIFLGGFLNTFVKIGIDSNNNRTGSGGTSAVYFDGVAWNHGSGRFGGGPGIDIGSNCFWIWLNHITGSGCLFGAVPIASAGTPGLSRASGIVTVTTSTPNSVTAGGNNYITIQNAGDTSFNGSFVVQTVISSTQFTYNEAGPDATSGGGQVITSQEAAINIDPGTGTGSGLVFIENWVLNSGGIRLVAGVDGGGVYVRNGTFEGDFTDPTMPPILVTNFINPMNVHVENVEVADTPTPVPGVQLDNWGGNFGAVISRVDKGVVGTATILGGTGDFNPSESALQQKHIGLVGTRVVGGGLDMGRRIFSPVAVPSPNLANTNPAAWVFQTGAGVITTGIADPAGGTNAGRVSSNAGQSTVRFYLLSNTPLALGDTYVYGFWQRANSGSLSGPPNFVLNANGFGTGCSCTPASGVLFNTGKVGTGAGGEWVWASGVCKVYTNTTNAGIALQGIVSNPSVIDFYSPVLMKFPSGTKTDNELLEIAYNLSIFPETAAQGEVTMFQNQLLRLGTTTFANLGTPSSGVMIHCSDCAIANPCAGGGTGAFAKRLNGVWVCN